MKFKDLKNLKVDSKGLKDLKIDTKNIKLEEELFNKYWRILKLARTPGRDEFQKIAMVAALGIIAIGIVGFFIFEIFYQIQLI
ncbi:MAG TPA: protein translocase SEC61 complex subunit gamma [Methanomicrobiales archaeon]|nr:protein translocase SEC61 complex subunit gamma [Methanomicrobiales archaeon]